MNQLDEICKFYEYKLMKIISRNMIEIKKKDKFISIVAYYNNMKKVNFKSFSYNESNKIVPQSISSDLIMDLKKFYFKHDKSFVIN